MLVPFPRNRTIAMSPFAKLNLRRNPFGEVTWEERSELAVADTKPWVEFLRHPATAVQFIGPCGHGKTTHVLAIARSLPGAPYVHLPLEGPRPAVPDRRPVLIDEAQRLGFWQRRRVFARGGPLVLGTHNDLSRLLRRSGLEVWTVDVAADLSADRLMAILNKRIEASRITNGEVPCINRSYAVALRRDFGTNIREIERHLYLQFQQLVQGGLSWPPAC
jgi:hypothetical protein